MQHPPEAFLLKKICQAFGINAAAANLIRSNSNLIYDCGDKILRLTPATVRTETDIQVELDWMVYLFEKGMGVAQIIPSIQGNRWEIFYSDTLSYAFIAVCFQKIIGQKVEKEQWDVNHLRRLGKLAGSLHRIGQDYQEKPQLTYNHWDEIVEHHCYDHFPQNEHNLKALYQEVVQIISKKSKTALNYGLVHYDIHYGNYLLDTAKQIILFDFEMTCKSWFINDIAIILFYMVHRFPLSERPAFQQQFMQHFFETYNEAYQLDEEEKEAIPVLLLYRDLLVYAFICHIWVGKVLTKHDIKLKQTLENSIAHRRKQLEL